MRLQWPKLELERESRWNVTIIVATEVDDNLDGI